MKFGKILLVLGFSVSFVAVSVEAEKPSFGANAVTQLTEQEKEEKEKALQRLFGIPCDPYPKCAG